MDFDSYQKAALRTAGEKCRGSIAYSMGGVGGEAGEYVDVCKKHLFHDKPYEESKEKAASEIGDVLWGLAQAADAWGLTLSEIAEGNIAKLLKRYPDGFSAAASTARVDVSPAPQVDPCDIPKCGATDRSTGTWRARYTCCLPAGHSERHISADGSWDATACPVCGKPDCGFRHGGQ